MSIPVTISQAKNHLVRCIKAQLVGMLHGSPAIGKSSIVKEIAREYGLKVIDIRLAQADPTDLLGLPMYDKETGKARYAPLGTFPLEGDPIPDGYRGWLVFLDEFSSAPKAVQAAAYRLVLDRQVGEHNLHRNVAIVCAGNLETDGAIVEEMSTAMQSRLVHLDLTIDDREWLDWAASTGIDHRIVAYIRFKPDMLYTFKPDHTDRTYASPRTWEFTHRLIHDNPVSREDLPLLAGTIGEGVANEFVSYCQIYKDLLSIEQIQANPEGVPVPGEPSILFALSGSLANHANEDNIEPLMLFIARLPIEFQIVTLRDLVRRNKALLQVKGVQAWITRNAKELF